MPRVNRYYLPGYVWHITHRCHKREFLLKFGRDRLRWLQWLWEAKKRFGVSILNYAVTSNHIHLIIRDDKGERGDPPDDATGSGADGTGIQPAEETEGCLLGGSVSSNGSGSGEPFESMHGLY